MLTVVPVDYQNTAQGEQLIMLLNAYACDPMGGGEALPETSKATLVEAMSKQPGVFSFIAYWDDTPVGLVNCVEGFSTFAAKPLCNIHDIAVIEGFRGRGISTALMQAVVAEASHRGHCKITLEVLTGNTPARHAYQNFGFKPYQLDPELGQAEFWEYKL